MQIGCVDIEISRGFCYAPLYNYCANWKYLHDPVINFPSANWDNFDKVNITTTNKRFCLIWCVEHNNTEMLCFSIFDESKLKSARTTLRKKCPYSELFCPYFSTLVYSRSISPYSIRMRENMDQNNSEYGHFSRSASSSMDIITADNWFNFVSTACENIQSRSLTTDYT